MQVPTPADLDVLENHDGTVGASIIKSFRKDLTRGALLTAYSRYSAWFHKSFRGTKRSHDDEEYVPSPHSARCATAAASSNDGAQRRLRPRT